MRAIFDSHRLWKVSANDPRWRSIRRPASASAGHGCVDDGVGPSVSDSFAAERVMAFKFFETHEITVGRVNHASIGDGDRRTLRVRDEVAA